MKEEEKRCVYCLAKLKICNYMNNIEYIKERAEKSWMSGKLKIWVVTKKEEKRWGLTKLEI